MPTPWPSPAPSISSVCAVWSAPAEAAPRPSASAANAIASAERRAFGRSPGPRGGRAQRWYVEPVGIPTASSTTDQIDSEGAVLERVPKQLYIGGRWRPASGGRTLAVEDPATGEQIAHVADAGAEDALAALAAASEAQAQWAAHPPRERGEILRRAFEAMIARRDELALLMTLEMGKSLAESRAEISYAAEFLRWFSEEAVRIHGRYMVASGG